MKRCLILLCATVIGVGLIARAQAAPPGCSRPCIERVKHRALRHQHYLTVQHWRAIVKPYIGWLESTARCESGSNWSTNTGNGFYGGLQFTLESWGAVGGHGLPSDASKLEQEYRAVRLLHIQGTGAWPACG